MTQQAILDFDGANAIARRGDDVVIAANEADIALRVHDALIARGHPVTDEFFSSRIGAVPISEKHHRIGTFDSNLAEFTGGSDGAVGVDDRNVVAGDGFADGACAADADGGAGGDDEIALGLAVGLVDAEAKFGLAPGEGFSAEGFTRGGDGAEREIKPAARVRDGAHHAERGGRQEDVADGVILNEAEGLFGVEFIEFAGDDRNAERKRWQETVQQSTGPRPVGGCPEPVAFLREELVHHLKARKMSGKDTMAMQSALGLACGAGSVDHQSGIIGARRDGDEFRGLGFESRLIAERGTIRPVGREDEGESV